MPSDSKQNLCAGASPRPSFVDLNATVSGIERTLRRMVGENIEVVLKLDPDVSTVFADTERIEQVLLNLALDACDGMTHGGVLVVETANVTLDGTGQTSDELQQATHVMLAVTDTGTGFGRAMVHGLVKRSGGQCRLRRQPGRGTTFCVYLPTQRPSPAGRAPALPASLERRSAVA